ncbi:MAG: hypothetical protein C5B55_06160 [Blastocatellia bacterium]|nr:MAG: hypothetical protein C5B55_06160 [Blastocatellia bacterium]
MHLLRFVEFVSDSLLSVAYPQPCSLCGSNVESHDLGVCCQQCWQLTTIFDGAETVCWKCGVVTSGSISPVRVDAARCHRCDDQSFTAARACGLYEYALRSSALQLKREAYLPKRLLSLLIATARRAPIDAATRVMPVPLHSERLKSRGFNQAAVIAEAVARSLNLPLDDTSLIRSGVSDKYRAGLDAKAREDTVTGAFSVRYPALVNAEDILLVDDVFTTGATASSCGQALFDAGARSVFVLTIARPRH